MAGQNSEYAWLFPDSPVDSDEARGSQAGANHGPGVVDDVGLPTNSKRRKIDVACQLVLSIVTFSGNEIERVTQVL